MTHGPFSTFEIDPFLDLSQLDDAIFETAQRNLRRDLAEFVKVFEASP